MEYRTPQNSEKSEVVINAYFKEDLPEEAFVDPYEGLTDEELKEMFEDWEADRWIEEQKAGLI